jgi:hypothetical protein
LCGVVWFERECVRFAKGIVIVEFEEIRESRLGLRRFSFRVLTKIFGVLIKVQVQEEQEVPGSRHRPFSSFYHHTSHVLQIMKALYILFLPCLARPN